MSDHPNLIGGTAQLQRIVSHLRSIKRHIPPDVTVDLRLLDEVADLLLIQAKNEGRLRKTIAAAELGRLGGRSKSEKKAQASRVNGTRPKRKRTPKPDDDAGR